MSIFDEKAVLRDEIRERFSGKTEEELATESQKLCDELLPHIPVGSSVCAYAPLKTEVDLLPLISELISRGDSVFLPALEDNAMVFRRTEDLNTLAPGALNICESPTGSEILSDGLADVVLVPGRAFDMNGNRLGRGNGNYDSWIQAQRRANEDMKFFGIAFECQIFDEVPVEEHDQKMDMIVTAGGLWEV
jgi:5-formyltetrahydrofolate cyclo-ligase